MNTKQGDAGSSFWSAPFVICVLLLGTMAIGLGPLTRYMKIALRKEPIPLRLELGKLDKSKLGPYRFVRAETLDPAILDTLGTDQYVDWWLEDTSVTDAMSPLRFARLFVTYYTGQPDPVPHTPDNCWIAGGYELNSAENTTVRVPAFRDDPEVPVRVVTFVKSRIHEEDAVCVVYTFHCNGRFTETRKGVRLAVNNPRDQYAYFSKVEVVFGWPRARPRFPTVEDSILATEKLFSFVLPVLVAEHWADWEAVKRDEAAPDRPAES